MRTILYQPVYINPQAYFVFPSLYHIEKGDSYVEPAVYTGQLLIDVVDDADQTEQINQIKSNLNAEISRATQAEQNLATTLATKADSEAVYTKQETTDIVNAAKVTVNNTLTSDSIVEALSAAQGKQLMNLINALTDRVTALETPEVPTV